MILPIGRRSQAKNKGFTPPFLLTKRYCESEKAGFTFIELVLVTIIILVLVGLSTPLFRKPFRGIQLKNTCQDLVQLMRYAQARAVAERRFCRVNFNFDSNKFWLTIQSDSDPLEFKPLKERWGKTLRAPEGIFIDGELEGKIDDETSFITFYPDGSSDKAKIKISDNKGRTFSITTQRNIGYVKVEE